MSRHSTLQRFTRRYNIQNAIRIHDITIFSIQSFNIVPVKKKLRKKNWNRAFRNAVSDNDSVIYDCDIFKLMWTILNAVTVSSESERYCRTRHLFPSISIATLLPKSRTIIYESTHLGWADESGWMRWRRRPNLPHDYLYTFANLAVTLSRKFVRHLQWHTRNSQNYIYISLCGVTRVPKSRGELSR